MNLYGYIAIKENIGIEFAHLLFQRIILRIL